MAEFDGTLVGDPGEMAGSEVLVVLPTAGVATPGPELETEPKSPPTKKKATPKKRGPKASKSGNDDAASLEEPPSPKAMPPKKKTPAKKKDAVAEGEVAASTQTPKPAKRTPAKKKTATAGASEDDAPTPDSALISSKKTTAKKAAPKSTPKAKVKVDDDVEDQADDEAVPETPTSKSTPKKRKAAEPLTTTPKSKGRKTNPIAGSYEELSKEDKLIVDMKTEGKKWPDIESAWQSLVGRAPGKDTLRKRWPALEAASVKFSEEDIQAMLAAKASIEKSIWSHVAEKMKSENNITLSAKVLETKFEWLQRAGRIGANGTYIAPVVATPPSTSDPNEADGEESRLQAENQPGDEFLNLDGA